MRISSILSSIAIITLFTACAAKPILAPNEKYERMGHQRSERDIDDCMKRAENQLKLTRGRRVLRSAVTGAVVGGVVGGVAGSAGHTGALGGAAIGSAVGGGVGALHGALTTPEQAKRGLVNYCLNKKGYQIAGWED